MSKKANQTLLEVRGLKTHFYTESGVVRAVDGVDLVVRRGEVLGLVGESGCGKSVTSLSIMKLISQPGEIVEGEIIFDNEDLVRKPESEMTRIRGNRISMIFQQPTSCLNPVFRVGEQLAEVLYIHQDVAKGNGQRRAVELLSMVGIPEPESRARAFPHELSGGMAQRVMIAMALACVPELLIADEPTTALDVTIQAQILDLMRNLGSKMETSIILITHDLNIALRAGRMVRLKDGKIIEDTLVDEARRDRYFAALQDESRREDATGAGYINGDSALFERIDSVDGAFNRLVVYRRNSLHSGNIDNRRVPPADVQAGRLSVNSFIDVLDPGG